MGATGDVLGGVGVAGEHDRFAVRLVVEELVVDADVEGDAESTGKAVHKDAGRGKATFVPLLGVERARTQAKMLIDQAIEHLQHFGQEADLLRAIAVFAIERDR